MLITVKPSVPKAHLTCAAIEYNDRRQIVGKLNLGLFIILICTGFLSKPATALTPNICDAAAHQIASETDVPISVLLSITRTETGRTHKGRLLPWPWTVNMEGKGHWFETEDAARAYVFKQFKRGARSFDVGCFQINYKWHGAAFQSIDQMFDPIENARYAAKFLNELYSESNDWSKAAGAYHSRTPKYAEKYTARFDRIRQKVLGQPEAPQRPAAPRKQLASAAALPKRVNHYPLLQITETKAAYGSLVPLSRADNQALFQNAQPIAGLN